MEEVLSQSVSVFVVEDNADHIHMIESAIRQELAYTFHFENYADGAAVLNALQKCTRRPDLILLDYHIPGKNGIEVLHDLRQSDDEIPVIMITSDHSVENAVQAIKEGALDYITKPLRDPKVIGLSIEKALRHRRLLSENEFLRRQISKTYLARELASRSEKIAHIKKVVDRVAPTPSTVLITGESGTGKELWARYIHSLSPRSSQKFLALNCSALPEHLLESELFGHVKGAFTGAIANKPGLLKEAHGGTFFFDEIAELPLPMQTKLLRFLEDHEIRQTGAVHCERLNVRIIAATNLNLESEVKNGRFRQDLYYRLNVMRVHLPSLSERLSDIPLLIDQFIREFNLLHGTGVTGVEPEALQLLMTRMWPGNIRQLKNVIERALIFAEHDKITLNSLTFLKDGMAAHEDSMDPHSPVKPFHRARAEALRDFTAGYLQALLERNQGSVTRAARSAELGRQSFHRLLKRYGIQAREFKR